MRSLIAALAVCLVLCAPRVVGAVIVIINTDAPGEGFNDPTPVAPVGGNPGTTRGAQRLAVFGEAASIWSEVLPAGPEVRVRASFGALGCNFSSAVLGAAGPVQVLRDFDGAPLPGTWYVAALANQLAGRDLTPGEDEIEAQFSSQLGTPGCPFSWYYGLDSAAPAVAGTIDLLSVVLHEFAHGLGFLSLVDVQTGVRLLDRDDAYMVNLEDHTTGKTFPQMTNFERALAIVKPEQLHWIGSAVTAMGGSLVAGVGPNGHVHMYSPPSPNPGSSVSHYSTALMPNELMEPSYTGPERDVGLTLALFEDLGWPTNTAPGGACVPSSTALCLQGNRFRVEATWRDFTGHGGPARVVAGAATTDSGLLYFYGPNNWEILIKVLDGCGANGNGNYWVFAAAATTLEFELTVTDTATGAVRTYTNPLGMEAPAITDTFAFDSCG